MKKLGVWLIAATAVILASCRGDGSAGVDGVVSLAAPASVTITVSPQTVSLAKSARQQFTCTVTGAKNKSCKWSVQEGAAGGAITSKGVYRAPATDGVYHVIATSAADPTKTAVATVTVGVPTPPPPPPASGSTWVTGYYAGWLWDQTYPPSKVDMTAMTHFVFGRVAPGGGTLGGAAGAVVQGAGTAHQPGLSPDGVRSVEDYLVKKAHDANAKAVLMLGGAGDGQGFLRSTTDAVRPTFVRNLVDYMVAHDYDGVDIDWEDRLEGDSSLGVSATEARRRLKALITDIRANANARSRYQTKPVIVTFPGYAVSINFLQPGGKVEQWQADVANMVDQYNLMSYGSGTAWNGSGWNSWFSGPVFGATGNTPYDLDTSIKAYVATGVPRNKMGIGIGFFGMYYGPTITGPRQPTDGNNIFVADDNALAYSELVRKGYLNAGTYRFDDAAKASYRSYSGGYVPANDPASPRAGYLTYEDERSIAAKGQWVRETGVGGTILWTINYGYLPSTGTNPLLAAVKQAFLPTTTTTTALK